MADDPATYEPNGSWAGAVTAKSLAGEVPSTAETLASHWALSVPTVGEVSVKRSARLLGWAAALVGWVGAKASLVARSNVAQNAPAQVFCGAGSGADARGGDGERRGRGAVQRPAGAQQPAGHGVPPEAPRPPSSVQPAESAAERLGRPPHGIGELLSVPVGEREGQPGHRVGVVVEHRRRRRWPSPGVTSPSSTA